MYELPDDFNPDSPGWEDTKRSLSDNTSEIVVLPSGVSCHLDFYEQQDLLRKMREKAKEIL